jgi:hypothetical protein
MFFSGKLAAYLSLAPLDDKAYYCQPRRYAEDDVLHNTEVINEIAEVIELYWRNLRLYGYKWVHNLFLLSA